MSQEEENVKTKEVIETVNEEVNDESKQVNVIESVEDINMNGGENTSTEKVENEKTVEFIEEKTDENKEEKKFENDGQLEKVEVSEVQVSNEESIDNEENMVLEKSGYLYKKGDVNKAVKKRWFQLNNKEISYGKNEAEMSQPNGSIELVNIKEVYFVRGETKIKGIVHYEFNISVNNSNRVYQLYVEDHDEVYAWVEIIDKAVKRFAKKNPRERSQSLLQRPVRSSRSFSLLPGGAGTGGTGDKSGDGFLRVTDFIRGLVSKKKKRFQESGYDLDLTYVTDRLIAMGLPSEGKEALYRNPMSQVIEFFEEKHPDSYMIYNLCEEKSYDHSKFKSRVEIFPFPDHNPPPLVLMKPFCANVIRWLDQNDKNVAVIHCKAGKGRTGTMIASILLHTGIYSTAKEALEYFGKKRTLDGKGVTIPSQIRYVNYYEECLKNGFPKKDKKLNLTKIEWSTIPETSPGGCTPTFKISLLKNEVYDWNENHKNLIKYEDKVIYTKGEVSAIFELERDVILSGDVRINFYDAKEKMFHFWFNTNMIKDNFLILHKKGQELDGGAKKDKKCEIFQELFEVSIYFESVE